MSKTKRTISFAAINIVTHPHSEEIYRDLFLMAHELKNVANLKERNGTIGTAYLYPELGNIISGDLVTFTSIKLDEPWQDLKTWDEAGEAKAEKARKDIENIRPGRKTWRYVFYPKHHKLIYVCNDVRVGGLAPSTAVKLLRRVLSTDYLLEAFKLADIEVFAETDSHEIMEAFDRYTVNKLSLDISRPNDDPDAFKNIEEEYRRRGIGREKVEYTAGKNETIKPDQKMKDKIKYATSYGHADLVARDENNKKVDLHTEHMPVVEKATFGGDQSFSDFCVSVAGDMVTMLLKKFGK